MKTDLTLDEFVERLNIKEANLTVNTEKTAEGTYLLYLREGWGPIVEEKSMELAKLKFEKYFEISNAVTQAIVLKYYYSKAREEKLSETKTRHMAEEKLESLKERDELIYAEGF